MVEELEIMGARLETHQVLLDGWLFEEGALDGATVALLSELI